MSPYVQRRVLARTGLGLVATVCGVGFLAGFEAVAGHRPEKREFLYEPHPRALIPTPTPAPTPKPLVETFDFCVRIPAKELGPGLKPNDFLAKGAEVATQYMTVRAGYVSQVTSKKVERSGPSVALVLDQSGSIQTSDPQDLRISASEQFVDAVPESTRLSVFTFGELGETAPADQPHAGFGTTKEEVKQALQDRSGKASGGTETFRALGSVIPQMAGEPANSAKMILCFTDGQAGDSLLAPQVEAAAKQAGIKIWFVALGAGDFSENERVARATGGGLITAQSASELATAFAKLASKVVREDNSYYNITIQAKRVGVPFVNGEVLKPSIEPRSGKQAPSTFEIPVQK
jgi:hypothetical protein